MSEKVTENSSMIPTPDSNGRICHEVTADLRRRLTPKFGEGETRAIIRLIFHHLKGWNATDLVINEDKPLSEFTLRRIEEIVARLFNDEPIQYITGEAYFYGMDLSISPGVLIPRPETEELVDLVVKQNQTPDLRILDACSGSGAIAIALARNIPFASVDALDLSDKAVELSTLNARKLKAKINVLKEDIFNYNPPRESLDIIVSNPPYIDESEKSAMQPNVLLYEPHEALFVPDSDPLVFYRRIADIGSDALRPGGKIYFEINPRHADQLVVLLKEKGFREPEIHLDIHGRKRFLSAIR